MSLRSKPPPIFDRLTFSCSWNAHFGAWVASPRSARRG